MEGDEMREVAVQPGDFILLLENREIREFSQDDARVFVLAQIGDGVAAGQDGEYGHGELVHVSKAWLPTIQEGQIVWEETGYGWPLVIINGHQFFPAEGDFLVLRAKDMQHATDLLRRVRKANTDHRMRMNAELERHALALSAIHERLETELSKASE